MYLFIFFEANNSLNWFFFTKEKLNFKQIQNSLHDFVLWLNSICILADLRLCFRIKQLFNHFKCLHVHYALGRGGRWVTILRGNPLASLLPQMKKESLSLQLKTNNIGYRLKLCVFHRYSWVSFFSGPRLVNCEYQDCVYSKRCR
jgi:hypothetical protein